MNVLLLFAGLIIAAASAATLGYQAAGARIGAADALTVTAIIGLVGGFILVGLSAIAGQVRRIADALEAQPVGRSLDFLPERRPADAAAMAGTNAVAAALALEPEAPAMPAPPMEPPMAASPLEPSTEPSTEPTVGSAVEVLSQATIVVTPPAIPASAREPERRDDKAPPVLSPVASAAPGAPAPVISPAPVVAPAGPTEWPHVNIADRPVPTANGKPRAPVEPALGPRTPAPPVRSPAAPPERPASERAASERPAPERATPERAAAERTEPERPAAERAGPERAAPAVAAAEPASAPKPEAPRVLKSGVIEGMAYTLFSDGSVDAELPQGTTHFPSISAWRAHLRENT